MRKSVTHAHIGKMLVFGFYVTKLPLIVTVQEKVTHVHTGRLYVPSEFSYYYGLWECYACAYFVRLFPTFIFTCSFPVFCFCVFMFV